MGLHLFSNKLEAIICLIEVRKIMSCQALSQKKSYLPCLPCETELLLVSCPVSGPYPLALSFNAGASKACRLLPAMIVSASVQGRFQPQFLSHSHSCSFGYPQPRGVSHSSAFSHRTACTTTVRHLKSMRPFQYSLPPTPNHPH